jgi:flagellar biosynthetic protein FliR
VTFNLLDHFLLAQIYAFLMIFCRIGSMMMVVPGFSEVYVPTQVRLLFSLLFSLILTPLLEAQMPPVPTNVPVMMLMITGEILIGVFYGLVVRMIFSAMQVAGTIIAAQSSLALSAVFDASQGGQSTIVSNFLSLAALVCFFALNLHHLLIGGIVDSYNLMPAGVFPLVADMNHLLVRQMADAFMIGVALSGPHLAFSLVFYLLGGMLTRLMPNFQIFFVMLPPQILLSFLLLIIGISTMMLFYMRYIEDALMAVIGGL